MENEETWCQRLDITTSEAFSLVKSINFLGDALCLKIATKSKIIIFQLNCSDHTVDTSLPPNILKIVHCFHCIEAFIKFRMRFLVEYNSLNFLHLHVSSFHISFHFVSVSAFIFNFPFFFSFLFTIGSFFVYFSFEWLVVCLASKYIEQFLMRFNIVKFYALKKSRNI